MPDSLAFTIDVFRIVCDRLRSKADDLQLLIEDGSSFEEWLHWESYLACKLPQEGYSFCAVTANPTYASEWYMSLATRTATAATCVWAARTTGPTTADCSPRSCWLAMATG